jgi:hypothetical protein
LQRFLWWVYSPGIALQGYGLIIDKCVNMRKIIFIACMILFSSCHQSNVEIVKSFIDAKNCYDTEKMNLFLSDDFMFYGSDTSNKSEYITDKTVWDILKTQEQKTIILKIQDLDSIVKTEEKVTNITDSLLEVTPKFVAKRTYRFWGNKLKSITVDSLLNLEDYQKSLNEKYIPFAFYIQDKYNIQDEMEINTNIKKYLMEYVSLTASDRKQYSTYANLQGTFESKDNPFYKKLIFKGKKTVSIVDTFFDLSFATSYEVDEKYIKIRTDKSDLLFEIKDSKTLIGEGFARGTFTKTN